MYQHLKNFYGKHLGATDGHIGHVEDFYFDDRSWVLRYLVVNTGSWLSSRRVLLAPHSFVMHPFAGGKPADILSVNLTRKQIQDSPSFDTQRPVSRQYEEEYHRHYCWPVYWGGGGVLDTSIPIEVPVSPGPADGEVHLRSAKEVIGYQLQASDGPLGVLDDFLIEDRSWCIREMLVETGHWYYGKEVRVLPGDVAGISYEDSTIRVRFSKAQLRETQENEIVSRGALH